MRLVEIAMRAARGLTMGANCRIAASVATGIAVVGALSGCGTPGAPQAPSLRLPGLVSDLTAVRAGNTVTLRWTMPRKTTDHLLISNQIRGPIAVRVCLRLRPGDDCQTVSEISIAQGAEGRFEGTLPASVTLGEPRELMYFVELKNKPGQSGRSAGLSNGAVVLGGASPPAVLGLTAKVHANGVALQWQPEVGPPTALRLHRKLVAADAVSKGPPGAESRQGKAGVMSAGPEPVLQDLFVAASEGQDLSGALDNSARFGEVYAYSAQRVVQLKVDGKALELDGPISPAIQVDVVDSFPPSVPIGLAAVAVNEPAGTAIDLSWVPNTESDLAGYIVYRSAARDGRSGDWVRVSGPELVKEPAFRDNAVQAGHTYFYGVSAIDVTGHESDRSVEAEEAVPIP